MAERGPERAAKGGRRSGSGRALLVTASVLVLAAAGLVGWLQWTESEHPGRHALVVATIPLPPVARQQPQPQPAQPAAPATVPQAEAPAPAQPAPPAQPQQQAALPAPKPPALPAPPPGKVEALTPAPDPALIEKSSLGPLPVIGPDGRRPWQVYARPFDRTNKRPRIAVMMTGLGLSGAATEAAINDLPGAVTLVFNPYAQRLEDWIQRARAAGHEVFLSLAMEPLDYPRMDPGPHTLLVSLNARQNLDRLQWVLSRVTGYVGTLSSAGSRFTTSRSDMLPVLDALNKRGLMFVDGHSTDRSVAVPLAKSLLLPRAMVDIVLDQQASRDAIDARLRQLETLARQTGVAVGAGEAYPVTIERLAQWAPTLDAKGFALAPVSATADLQSDRAEASR